MMGWHRLDCIVREGSRNLLVRAEVEDLCSKPTAGALVVKRDGIDASENGKQFELQVWNEI